MKKWLLSSFLFYINQLLQGIRNYNWVCFVVLEDVPKKGQLHLFLIPEFIF